MTLSRDFGVTRLKVRRVHCVAARLTLREELRDFVLCANVELSRENVPLGLVSTFWVYDTVSLKLANALLFQSREFVYLC